MRILVTPGFDQRLFRECRPPEIWFNLQIWVGSATTVEVFDKRERGGKRKGVGSPGSKYRT